MKYFFEAAAAAAGRGQRACWTALPSKAARRMQSAEQLRPWPEAPSSRAIECRRAARTMIRRHGAGLTRQPRRGYDAAAAAAIALAPDGRAS